MPNFLLGGGNVGRAQDFQGQMAEFLRTTEGFRRNQTQLAIEQEEAKKLQQMNEQAAKDAKEWHPDAVLAVIPAHLRPIYKQVLERSGMINPNGTVLGKDARTLNEQFYKHPDLQFQAGELEVAELQKQVDKAKTPEDRDAVIERLNALRLWQNSIKAQLEKKEKEKTGQLYKVVGQSGKGEYQPAEEAIGMQPYDKPEDVDEWSEPYVAMVGDKPVLLRTNLRTKKVEQVSSGPAGTTVNVDVDTGVTKAEKAKLEEGIREGTDLYTDIATAVKLVKPEYLTIAGKARAAGEAAGEIAGVVKDPKFLEKRTAWKVATDQTFQKYRKWATGVAAGEKELKMLESSFPNTRMSYTEYKSAARQTFINVYKGVKRKEAAKALGYRTDKELKEYYSRNPLGTIPGPSENEISKFLSPEAESGSKRLKYNPNTGELE